MEHLINEEMMKVLEFAEEQGQIPNFLRLKRLSYKRSFFVVDMIFNWYSLISTQTKDRQVIIIK
jgi:hypothetical protein